jgi:hypothetical protein
VLLEVARKGIEDEKKIYEDREAKNPSKLPTPSPDHLVPCEGNKKYVGRGLIKTWRWSGEVDSTGEVLQSMYLPENGRNTKGYISLRRDITSLGAWAAAATTPSFVLDPSKSPALLDRAHDVPDCNFVILSIVKEKIKTTRGEETKEKEKEKKEKKRNSLFAGRRSTKKESVAEARELVVLDEDSSVVATRKNQRKISKENNLSMNQWVDWCHDWIQDQGLGAHGEIHLQAPIDSVDTSGYLILTMVNNSVTAEGQVRMKFIPSTIKQKRSLKSFATFLSCHLPEVWINGSGLPKLKYTDVSSSAALATSSSSPTFNHVWNNVLDKEARDRLTEQVEENEKKK